MHELVESAESCGATCLKHTFQSRVPKSEDPLVVAQDHLKCCPGHLSFEANGPKWPPKISVVNEFH